MDIKQPEDDTELDQLLPAEELSRQFELETELTADATIDLSRMQRGPGLTATLKRKVRAYCDRHGVSYGAALAYLAD